MSYQGQTDASFVHAGSEPGGPPTARDVWRARRTVRSMTPMGVPYPPRDEHLRRRSPGAAERKASWGTAREALAVPSYAASSRSHRTLAACGMMCGQRGAGVESTGQT